MQVDGSPLPYYSNIKMSYPALTQDMVLEILSYCPASSIEKFKFLNTDYYKRMSESWFINLNHSRTNSIFGVFLQYEGYYSTFNSSFVLTGDGEVSLDFLPIERVKIEACDASHGIFLCVASGYLKKTPYVVCKLTTREYQTIPTPETGYSTIECDFKTIVSGLMVIRTNPLRYKIVKISKQSKIFTVICEVFDSDSFVWKRLDDFKQPQGGKFILSSVPVRNNQFLNWLASSGKNVIRFCMKTETWSLHPLPSDLPNYYSLQLLANQGGKLGIVVWKPKVGLLALLFASISLFTLTTRDLILSKIMPRAMMPPLDLRGSRMKNAAPETLATLEETTKSNVKQKGKRK
ncbi:hypothetical protein HID58_005168 [Brassica napus]|uniref:F-box domain-containing protein n=1 Tax=Brassica napus TaxID=3708 RepID=A0ABQ8E7V0_BRANA|nr:hypothetical protein HID58_005168 [Brassica napus]